MGYQVGDIFEWVNTGTKQFIYGGFRTTYFRDIRHSYEISWKEMKEFYIRHMLFGPKGFKYWFD